MKSRNVPRTRGGVAIVSKAPARRLRPLNTMNFPQALRDAIPTLARWLGPQPAAHFHHRTGIERAFLWGQARARQIPGGGDWQTDRQVRRLDGYPPRSRARPGAHVEPARRLIFC